MAIIDITEFERLINNSKLDGKYKSLIKGDIIYAINQNKGVGFGFINNEDFLKTVEVILNYEQQDSEIYTLLTRYLRLMNNNQDFLKTTEVILSGKQQDSELARYLRLINNNKHYWSFIVEDMAKDENKDAIFNFLKDENLFIATEIISNSSIQEDMKYLSTMATILCLKDNNEQQKKSSIILYALLVSYDVISTYREQTIPDALLASHSVTNIYTKRIIPRALCIKRPNNKRSDVKMSDYLLDSQMIKEDISWLKKTNQEAFQKLHNQIKKMQDREVKETFNDYCNQINSHEKREALIYTAVALAIVCTASVRIAIRTENIVDWLIAAVTGIIAVTICGYLLCSSRLECVELEKIKNPPKHPIDNPTCIFIK